MVKYKGVVLTDKPVCAVKVSPNWNNDMIEYYPKISVIYMSNSVPVHELFDTDSNDPFSVERQLEYSLDQQMVNEYKAYFQQIEHKYELNIIEKGRIVQVVKGRKLPLGTIGKVFWKGLTKYGTSVGIELENGDKAFTALDNVKGIA